jgi:hypothetical protein
LIYDLLVSDSQTLDWHRGLSTGDAMRVNPFHRRVEIVGFIGKEFFCGRAGLGWLPVAAVRENAQAVCYWPAKSG